MSTAATSGPSPGASLHPVKLSRVPAHWSETSALRHQLAALERDVDEYDRLATKLEGVTDEPVWDAMVRTRVCGVVLFLVWWGGRTGCLVGEACVVGELDELGRSYFHSLRATMIKPLTPTDRSRWARSRTSPAN